MCGCLHPLVCLSALTPPLFLFVAFIFRVSMPQQRGEPAIGLVLQCFWHAQEKQSNEWSRPTSRAKGLLLMGSWLSSLCTPQGPLVPPFPHSFGSCARARIPSGNRGAAETIVPRVEHKASPTHPWAHLPRPPEPMWPLAPSTSGATVFIRTAAAT